MNWGKWEFILLLFCPIRTRHKYGSQARYHDAEFPILSSLVKRSVADRVVLLLIQTKRNNWGHF